MLDLNADEGAILFEELEDHFKGFADLWDLMRSKDSQDFQQSTLRWLKEGDVNLS